MIKLRKNAAALALVALLAIFGSACASDSGGETSSEPAAEASSEPAAEAS